MSHWTDSLRRAACADGIEDGRQYATFADWWRGTQRSDYMLWLLEQVAYPDDRKLRLLACRFIREIAVDTTRTVWDLLTDERSRSAVVAAEQYAKGRATDGELEAAASLASDAASLARNEARAATSAACAAAWVAARDARDARGAAWAASAAAWAAVSAAECAVAMESARAQQADIIRDMIPATEIAPLFERYIQTLQGGDQ